MGIVQSHNRCVREGLAMSGKDFDGFVVLVTGASTGLGRAIAVEGKSVV